MKHLPMPFTSDFLSEGWTTVISDSWTWWTTPSIGLHWWKETYYGFAWSYLQRLCTAQTINGRKYRLTFRGNMDAPSSQYLELSVNGVGQGHIAETGAVDWSAIWTASQTAIETVQMLAEDPTGSWAIRIDELQMTDSTRSSVNGGLVGCNMVGSSLIGS